MPSRFDCVFVECGMEAGFVATNGVMNGTTRSYTMIRAHNSLEAGVLFVVINSQNGSRIHPTATATRTLVESLLAS